jgi:hypothetical protein
VKQSDNPVTLSEEDLEAALRLLAVEDVAEPDAVRGRDLVYSLFSSLGIGIFLVTLPLGLAVVWFNWIWGVALFVAAAGSLLLASLTATRAPERRTRRLRDSLVGSEIEEVASAVWAKREATSDRTLILILMGGAAVTIYGLIRLGFGLAESDQVDWLAVILIILPPLAFWTFFAWTEYREFQYFANVSTVRNRLETQVASGSNDREVALTPAEFEVVSRAETQHIERGIAEAMKSVAVTESQGYSVILAANVIELLPTLDFDTFYQIRQTIDGLQLDPRPEGARVLSSEAPETELLVEQAGAAITYRIDDENRQIVVVKITRNGWSDASS